MGKLFYSGPCSNKVKYVIKLGRLELSRFIKLISGHNGLFYFKHQIDKEINSICRFCLEKDETFYHLATDCPVFWQTRNDVFQDKPINDDMSWSVNDLLIFSKKTGIRQAIDGETNLRLFGDALSGISGTDSPSEEEVENDL